VDLTFADSPNRGLVNLKLGKLAEAIEDYSQSLQKSPRSVSSPFGRGIAAKRTGGDGSADLNLAQSMDQKYRQGICRLRRHRVHPETDAVGLSPGKID
jgi:hypothetical protein